MGPLLVEGTSALKNAAELEAEDAVVSPTREGLARIVLSNISGFTQVVDGGVVIGEATTVSVEKPTQSVNIKTITNDKETDVEESSAVVHRVRDGTADQEGKSCSEVIRTTFSDKIDTLPHHKEQLLCLLTEHHSAFCLETGERGETDLVEFHIDTGNASPLRQHARRMPFAVRMEVAKQCRSQALFNLHLAHGQVQLCWSEKRTDLLGSVWIIDELMS